MAIALKLIEMMLPDGTAVAAPSYVSASALLSSLAGHGGGNVHFTARFADGKAYSGDATIEPGHTRGYDLGAHIREQAEMYTGERKPAHLSKKDYLATVAKVPPEQRAFLKLLLEKYDLSGAPVPAEAAAPAEEPQHRTLKEMRSARLDAILVRPEVERVEPRDENDHKTDLEDGFFPPGPAKDITHYTAPKPAEGFKLPTPEGQN